VPLVFDLVDTWNNKVIGGCTYFVNHPGGRSFDTYPVNSFEAESRKMSRFWDFGHTPSTSIEVREIGKEAISNQAATSRFLVESKSELKPDTPIELINPEYPYTLDLRHYWKAKK
jgi:uncharacterized protein (DUF2126 family)